MDSLPSTEIAELRAMASRLHDDIHADGGIIDEIGDLREAVIAMQTAIGGMTLAVQEHEKLDHGRHQQVMELLPVVKELIVEVRDGQKRTVGAVMAEIGADEVHLPVTGSVKLRTLIILVVLSLGSLGYLGIDGAAVWAWWTGDAASAHHVEAE